MDAQKTVRQGGREQHCRQRHGVHRAGRRKRSQETKMQKQRELDTDDIRGAPPTEQVLSAGAVVIKL